MMTMEQLCRHIIQLIHTPIRVYDTNGNQTAIYVDHGEQQDVLGCDINFCQMLLEKRKLHMPVLYLEVEHIVYGIISSEGETYILGPCCLSQEEISAARYLIRAHGLEPGKPYKIYRTSLYTFSEMVMMLFEMLTGRTITREELMLNCFCNEQFERDMQEKVHEVSYSLRENFVVHNPYSQEIREQEAIQKGDLDGLQRSLQEVYVGKIGTLSHNPVRQAKNISIVVITLASRSAIAGGLLPEVAFSMSDAFIQHIEKLRNIGQILALARQAEIEYCKAVNNRSSGRRQSPLVVRCKELIVQKLHSKLSVKSLAGELGITAGYLSHLFLREEGIRLTDYIAREKVEAAKKQLIYTDASYEAVAHSLEFVSQSHFGQTFKKWTGMTPKQYRENHKVSVKVHNFTSEKL